MRSWLVLLLAVPAFLPGLPARAVPAGLIADADADRLQSAVIGLLHSGQVEWIEHGHATAQVTESVDRNTLYRAGSVSKLLVALLALRAEEAGIVSLDDVVTNYLPGVIKGRGAESVTLAHLLEHTAALAGSSFAEYATGEPGLMPSDYLELRAPLSLRWPPGRHWSYSNPGYVLAARVLEVAWASDFDSLARKQLFEPLGMLDSHFAGLNQSDAGVMPSFSATGELLPTWQMPVRPAGALVTSASDLSRLVDMLLADGRLPDGRRFLSVESIERSERGQTSLASRAGLGQWIYGLGNFVFVLGDHYWRGHWGRTDGFQATVAYRRDLGVGFVILTNSADRGAKGRLREAVSNELMPESPAVIPEPLPLKGLPDASGIFVNISHDQVLRSWLMGLLDAYKLVVAHDHVLSRGVGPLQWGQTRLWWHEGGHRFRAENLPIASGSLQAHESGHYWIDGESYRAIGAWSYYLQWVVLLAGLAGSTIAVLWLIVDSILKLLWKKSSGPTRLRALLAGAGFSYLLMTVLFVAHAFTPGLAGAQTLGGVNAVSLTIGVASMLAPVLSLLALIAAFRSASPVLVARVLACCLAGLGLYLAVQGWLPLLTWL